MTKFLRGVWGSGALPQPVWVDETDAIENIVSGTDNDLICFRMHGLYISLLSDKGNYECDELDGDETDIHADQMLLHSDIINGDGSDELFDALTRCEQSFSGHEYVIYRYSYFRECIKYMDKWTMKVMSEMMNAFINRMRKVSILHGIKGNYDLTEESCTLDDLLKLENLKAVTIADSYNASIFTHVAVVSTTGSSFLTTRVLSRNPYHLEKRLGKCTDGKPIYVFSTEYGCLATRVYAPHLRKLNTIITHVQAEIYAAEWPNNVTYDDAGYGIFDFAI